MRQKILASFTIGFIAGLIDITPGLIQGVDLHITLTGFSFWVVMGPTIAFISLPMKDWLKGLVVASLLVIPGTILMSAIDPETIIPMIVLTIALGSLVGFLTGRYTQDKGMFFPCPICPIHMYPNTRHSLISDWKFSVTCSSIVIGDV